MKRKIFMLFAAAVAGMLVLTACTSSDSESAQTPDAQDAGAGTQASDTQGAGADVQSEGSGAEEAFLNSGAFDAFASATASVSQPATDSSAAASGTDGGEVAAPEEGGVPADDKEPDGDVIPDEDAEAAQNDIENSAVTSEDSTASPDEWKDEWSGTYIGDEETITVHQISAEQISFSFEQSGISGIAKIKEYQAIYNGDDQHVVVFVLDQDMIDVEVASEEDFDTSESPLIGHYVKQGLETQEDTGEDL